MVKGGVPDAPRILTVPGGVNSSTSAAERANASRKAFMVVSKVTAETNNTSGMTRRDVLQSCG